MGQSPPSRSPVSALVGISLAVVAGILTILTGAGFLGSVWWVLDLASHFRVQYAALLLPAVFILAGLRWKRMTWTGGVALLVNLALIVPLYLTRPAEAAGAATLRVLSFNVTASNPDRPAVIDYLERSGADVIFLHESSTDWEDAVERSGLPYRMVSAREPGSLFGTLALVDPNAAAEVLSLGGSGQWSIEVTTTVAGRTVTLLGTHPLSPVSRTRAAARDEQLRLIGAWAAQKGGFVAVVGDLNASTWSHGLSLVSRDARLINSQRGFGVQASWPVGLPLLRVPIDHLLHSPDLTTVDRSLGEHLGSDHFPILVTLAPATG